MTSRPALCNSWLLSPKDQSCEYVVTRNQVLHRFCQLETSTLAPFLQSTCSPSRKTHFMFKCTLFSKQMSIPKKEKVTTVGCGNCYGKWRRQYCRHLWGDSCFFSFFLTNSRAKNQKAMCLKCFLWQCNFPAALAAFSTVWTFLQLWPRRSVRMAKRNNDVPCLGREDIIVADYVTVFSLLSCYQTANCTAFMLCENWMIHLANIY